MWLLIVSFRWCVLAPSLRHCAATPAWTTLPRQLAPSSRTQLRSTRCSQTSTGSISPMFRFVLLSLSFLPSCLLHTLVFSVRWSRILTLSTHSQEQASWVCQCEDRVVQRLEQDFKMTLQQQNSLEQWASWLDGVVSQALKPYEHNPVSLPKAAKVFLLNWSFYRWEEKRKQQYIRGVSTLRYYAKKLT